MDAASNIIQPFVTIIIPTYKDWERLNICVAALQKQTYPKDRFEVIITNNDPSDPRPAQFVLPENFSIIDVVKPGSYAARNAGIRLAKGEIIGFTDSDCIPARDWIQNAVQYFLDHPSCSRIAGHISIFYHHKQPTSAELYDSMYSFRQKRYAEEKGTCVTGNMFTYKVVFQKVGLFNEKQFSYGDLIWGQQAHRAGYPIHYVRKVVVQHPARSMRELVKKERRLGGGAGIHKRGKISPATLFFNLINGCRPRVTEVKYVFKNGKELDFLQKCTVLFIRHYLLNVRTYEQIRVTLGKSPNRA